MKRLVVTLMLAVFLIGSTAAQPQQKSSVKPGMMPGHPLYSIEKTVEGLEVGLAGIVGGDDMKAKAIANNAEERLAEANALADRNRSKEAEKMVEEYSRSINKSQKLVESGNNTELSTEIENISTKNQAVLERVKQKVPEDARKGIQNAIENSKKMREKKKKPNLSEETPENLLENRTDRGLNRANKTAKEKKDIGKEKLANITERKKNKIQNQSDEVRKEAKKSIQHLK